jgi:hypothetical protein
MGEIEHKERRGIDRTGTDVPLVCRIPARPSAARILDVSTYGCRVALSNNDAEKGASIVFEMPNGDRMNGMVVWVQGGEAGVRFAHALRPATARVLGLEVEEPETVVTQPAPDYAESRGLRHWYRRLTAVFG